MEYYEGATLLHEVRSKNFNKDGDAIEWHPMMLGAEVDVERDTMELGLRVAWYFYDENYWGEGALSTNNDFYGTGV